MDESERNLLSRYRHWGVTSRWVHLEQGHSDMYCPLGLCAKSMYPKHALGERDWDRIFYSSFRVVNVGKILATNPPRRILIGGLV